MQVMTDDREESPVDTDREAIKRDLQVEELLERDLQELEREVAELEAARARRKAYTEGEEQK
jgi:hypothetical protein